MLEPTGSVLELGVGGGLDGLEDGNISLRGLEALNIALVGEVVVEDGNTGVTVEIGKAHLKSSKNLNQGRPGLTRF